MNNSNEKNTQHYDNELLATAICDTFVQDYVSLHMFEFAEHVYHTVTAPEEHYGAKDIVDYLRDAFDLDMNNPDVKNHIHDIITAEEDLLSRLAIFMYLKGIEDTCQHFTAMEELAQYATQDTNTAVVENVERVPMKVSKIYARD